MNNDNFMNDWIANAPAIGQSIVDGFNKALPVIKQVKGIVGNMFDIIKTGVADSGLSDLFSGIGDGLKGVLDGIESMFNNVEFQNFLSSGLTAAINGVIQFGQLVTNVITDLVNSPQFQNFTKVFVESFTNAWNAVSSLFSDNKLGQTLSNIALQFIDAISILMPVIESLISNVVKIVEPIVSVVDALMVSLMPAFQYLADAVSLAFDIIGTIIADVAPIINDLLIGLQPAFTAIGYVCHEIMKAVQAVWPTVSNIIKVAADIISPILDLIGSLAGLIAEIFSVLWPPIAGFVEGVWNIISPIFTGLASVLETICGWLTKAIDGVTGFIKSLKEMPGNVNNFFNGGDANWYNPFSWNYNGSHYGGLDNVPKDGYKAVLHKGEMVLPAKVAGQFRNTYVDPVKSLTPALGNINTAIKIQTETPDVKLTIANETPSITSVANNNQDMWSEYFEHNTSTTNNTTTNHINPQFDISITNNGVNDPEQLTNQVVEKITVKLKEISQVMVPALGR